MIGFGSSCQIFFIATFYYLIALAWSKSIEGCKKENVRSHGADDVGTLADRSASQGHERILSGHILSELCVPHAVRSPTFSV